MDNKDDKLDIWSMDEEENEIEFEKIKARMEKETRRAEVTHKLKLSSPKYLLFIILLFIMMCTPIGNRNMACTKGRSMYPTLGDREIIKIKRVDRTSPIERDTIVVARVPGLGGIVKRVIGIPGDTIKFSKEHIYINGEEFHSKAKIIGFDEVNGQIHLKDNEYLLMGDNRSVSLDSRYFGPVPRENIRAIYVKTIWRIKD